jgi:hypothetical protein
MKRLALPMFCVLASCGSPAADAPKPEPPADALIAMPADAAPPPDGPGSPGGAPDAPPVTRDAAPSCPAGMLLCAPLGPLPASLRETGLIPGAAQGEPTRWPGRAHAYAPSPDLWSDGLHKERAILLPEGGRVDNSDAKRWSFPVGTLFIKTFLDDGPRGPRPVETRLVRRVASELDPYEYAVYQWNSDGTDATLLDITGDRRTRIEITIGTTRFPHDLPSRLDCGECHDKNALVASAFIGFDEIRLNNKLTVAAPRTQLADLAAQGLFTAPLPAQAAEIKDPDPVLERVKRFVYGNCAHCHNGDPSAQADFRPDAFAATTIRKPVDASGVSAPKGWLRVVPGNPEMSVVYVQARGTNLPPSLREMPQVGVAVRAALPGFKAYLDDLRAWIMSLPR